MDPGSILWRVFFVVFPSSFFFPSFFQLELSPGMGSIPTRIQFFSYHSFTFLPFFFPSFAILFSPLFCPPLISSSPFPLPSFLFLSPILFFLLLVSFSFPICCFSFSLSSLFFILFLPPFPLLSLSHCFCFCFFFLAHKFLSCFTWGCYEHKG